MIQVLIMSLGLSRDRRAITAMEYGLIAAMVALGIIGALVTMGTTVSTTFSRIASTITAG